MITPNDKKNKSTIFIESQHVLKNISIGVQTLGTVVKDFEILLRWIDQNEIQLTEINNLFPMRILPKLNGILSNPIKILLKRPQQKSYPHINGLYLLIRVTALGLIVKKKTIMTLCLDKQLIEKWNQLNEIEKYFTLLQAWWCRGSEEILGDYAAGGLDFRYRWVDFFKEISQGGLCLKKQRQKAENLKYYPGMHNLALLELFGFVKIQHGLPTEESKGWKIESIKTTRFGEALIGSFIDALKGFNYEVHWESTEMSRTREYNDWLISISSNFSGFKQLLKYEEHEFQPGLHIFKVSLHSCWRRIAVSGSIDLDSFAFAILDAFEFNHEHLYRFSYKNRFGLTNNFDHPALFSDTPSTESMSIGGLPLCKGGSMLFKYDFGDCWEFEILLEDINPQKIDTDYKKVLEVHGKAPEQYV